MKLSFVKPFIIAGMIGMSGIYAAYAATPSDSSIKEYIALTKIEQNFHNDFQAGFIAVLEAQILETLRAEYDLNPEQTAKIKAIIIKHLTPVSQEISNKPKVKQAVLDNITQVIAKHLTQQEIDALNQFYRTPIGQNIAKKQSLMYQDFMKDFSQLLPNLMNDFDNDKNKDIFEKMGVEIADVLK